MGMQPSLDAAYWDRPPERWLKCPRRSDVILGRFIACKTPLKSKYDPLVPVEDRFTVDMLLQSVSRSNRRIALWIDLSNTTRYYDKEDVERAGILYMKISCPGRDGPPEQSQVAAFFEACNRVQQPLVLNNVEPPPMPLTIVHCTHGFNRTGFLISAYLVEQLDFDPQVAYDIFRKSRPPGIYKVDYINEFFRRYGDQDTVTPAAPERPSWHGLASVFEYESSAPPTVSLMPNGNQPALPATDGAAGDPGATVAVDETETANVCANGETTSALVNGMQQPLPAVFMEGKVPGVTQLTDVNELWKLKLLVVDYCYGKPKDDSTPIKLNLRFPGSQPVSMDMKNIYFLQSDYYRVSWKADGVRYMMLILEHNCIYMIDREFNFFRVPYLEFYNRKRSQEHLFNTLLDGEMIIDNVKDPASGAVVGTRARYLIYDIVHFGDDRVGLCDFDIRMTCISKEITGPRKDFASKNLISTAQDPFSVLLKEFGDVFRAKKIMQGDFLKNLTHEFDGLIFQPWKDPYKPGTCKRILKWKPPHLNSIDFRVKLKKPPTRTGMLPVLCAELWVSGKEVPFAVVELKPKSSLSPLKTMDDKIVELSVVLLDGKRQWKFLRERTDKTTPNAWRTAEAVWQSIEHPVTEEGLLRFIELHGKRHVSGGSSSSSSSSKVGQPLANGAVKQPLEANGAAAYNGAATAETQQRNEKRKSDQQNDSEAALKKSRTEDVIDTI